MLCYCVEAAKFCTYLFGKIVSLLYGTLLVVFQGTTFPLDWNFSLINYDIIKRKLTLLLGSTLRKPVKIMPDNIVETTHKTVTRPLGTQDYRVSINV